MSAVRGKRTDGTSDREVTDSGPLAGELSDSEGSDLDMDSGIYQIQKRVQQERSSWVGGWNKFGGQVLEGAMDS